MLESRPTHAARRLALCGLIALMAAAGITAAADAPATATESAAATASATTEQATPAAARSLHRPRLEGALRAHIDPETGELMMPSAKARQEATAALLEAFSTSDEGLRAVTTPSGYTYVDLRGRFYSGTTATVGPDGRVELHHGLPVDPENAETAAAPSSEEDQR